MREVLIAAVFAWPASRVKNWALRRLGMQVHRNAHIGPNVVLGVGDISIGRAAIGFGNVFRGLDHLRIADDVIIGNWNSVTVARAFSGHTPESCTLDLAEGSAITSRHCLDCSGGIFVGRFSTVSGAGSTLLTHGIDDVDNVQDCAPIVIGEYARLGSNNRLSLGAHLPARSITAMGSVVTPGLTVTGQLYAGVPARAKKAVTGAWFSRTETHTPVRAVPRSARVDPREVHGTRDRAGTWELRSAPDLPPSPAGRPVPGSVAS